MTSRGAGSPPPDDPRRDRPAAPAPARAAGPSSPRARDPRPTAARPPNLLGIAAIAAAVLVALWVTLGIFLPALGALGRAGSQPSALPPTLQLCDRTWARSPDIVTLTADEVSAREDGEPVVVDEAGPGVCPAAPCGTLGAADSACGTVVYVKTGDEFVAYELEAAEESPPPDEESASP